ncbi:MAG: hypothetical protein RR678_04805 [Lachnospiraceae bacterium]
MTILNIAIIIFVLMEIGNVLILYFAPDSKLGNGVAVFNPWFKAKEDEATELFAKYMANWVAGVKLIFIVLLLVILFVGNDITKLFAVFAMILSIATYYFRLNPIIKRLDNMGEITPKGYSKTLFVMITGFMLMFSTAVVIYFFVR